MDGMYLLSQIIPVRFTSKYRTDRRAERATWWQWRSHVWAHRTYSVG